MKKTRAESRLPYFFTVPIAVSLLLLLSGCQPQGDDIQEPASTVKITYGLYDNFDGQGCLQNFDGTFKAEAGLLGYLWQARDRDGKQASTKFPVVLDDAAHGNVCRMNVNFVDSCNYYLLYLNYPKEIQFSNELTKLTCSYDFKLTSFGYEAFFGFEFRSPGGGWFWVRIYHDRYNHAMPILDAWGHDSILFNDFFGIVDQIPIAYNAWYNVKVEILKTGANDVKIDLYLNNSLAGTQTVLDWLDADSGPIQRSFLCGYYIGTDAEKSTGEMVIDNIYAEYNNKTKI